MTNWRWLVPLALAAGCTGSGATQVLEGHLSGSGSVVRAVSGDSVIAATQVKSDGAWTLALPPGEAYRLEVLTANGTVHSVVARDGGGARALSFRVCVPQDPYDVGSVGDTGSGGGSGMGDGSGSCGGGDARRRRRANPTRTNAPASGADCDPAGELPAAATAATRRIRTARRPCDPRATAAAAAVHGSRRPGLSAAAAAAVRSGEAGCTCEQRHLRRRPRDPTENCPPPPPPGCDPTTDPNSACCDPAGNCEPPPPVHDGSRDGDPTNCPPPPPGCDPTTRRVRSDCDPAGNCEPPPPCTDPNDPTTCTGSVHDRSHVVRMRAGRPRVRAAARAAPVRPQWRVRPERHDGARPPAGRLRLRGRCLT